jgi:hypothetical protein
MIQASRIARDSMASRVVERHALSDMTSLRETLTRYYDSWSCAISHGRKRGFSSPEWIGKNDERNSAASWPTKTRRISSFFFIFLYSVFHPVRLSSCDVDVQLSHQDFGDCPVSYFLQFSRSSSILFTRSLHAANVFVANSIPQTVARLMHLNVVPRCVKSLVKLSGPAIGDRLIATIRQRSLLIGNDSSAAAREVLDERGMSGLRGRGRGRERPFETRRLILLGRCTNFFSPLSSSRPPALPALGTRSHFISSTPYTIRVCYGTPPSISPSSPGPSAFVSLLCLSYAASGLRATNDR